MYVLRYRLREDLKGQTNNEVYKEHQSIDPGEGGLGVMRCGKPGQAELGRLVNIRDNLD